MSHTGIFSRPISVEDSRNWASNGVWVGLGARIWPGPLSDEYKRSKASTRTFQFNPNQLRVGNEGVLRAVPRFNFPSPDNFDRHGYRGREQ